MNMLKTFAAAGKYLYLWRSKSSLQLCQPFREQAVLSARVTFTYLLKPLNHRDRIYVKTENYFCKVGHSRPLFNTVDNKQVNKCSIQLLPMTGFNPRTSGIGSDHSTNWVTITSLRHRMFVWTAREKISQSPSIIIIILSLLLSYIMWFEQLNSATYLLQNWKWIRWWK